MAWWPCGQLRVERTCSLASEPLADVGHSQTGTAPDFAMLQYAWNFYSLHSNQRLILFNFYLLLYMALASGFAVADWSQKRLFAVVAASAAAFISFIFFLLDRRRVKYIHLGQEALRYTEGVTFGEHQHDPAKLFTRSKVSWFLHLFFMSPITQIILVGLICAVVATFFELDIVLCSNRFTDSNMCKIISEAGRDVLRLVGGIFENCIRNMFR